MALFLDGTLLENNMDTSNFAHVIFQNVGKSYIPHAALECHYTLTQFIRPHPKDWVGIFKVNNLLQGIIKAFETQDINIIIISSCRNKSIALCILMTRLYFVLHVGR